MIGRTEEIAIMGQLLASKEAEMVAVVGRRRVGKTFLIRETYKQNIVFEFVGIQNGSRKEHLNSFLFELRNTFGKELIPAKIDNWLEAFQLLITSLSSIKPDKKPVIFIDELPWIAGPKSDFLKAFGYFWNSWASKNNVVVAVCGSATSWMVTHLIQNKGGLHNRVTRTIYLHPFTCQETQLFLKERGIKFNEPQITELYMALGGIPYYLKLVEKGLSVPQVVGKLCFEDKAPLKYEFQNLYAALFSNPNHYMAVIKACFSKWQGVTQSEIVKLSGVPSGGTLTKILEELEVSGFLMVSLPLGNKKKEKRYRLWDEFSIFYLRFVEGAKYTNFNAISQSQAFKAWQGYAFENFCFKHIHKIKQKLGISGIVSNQYSYSLKPQGRFEGAQIDLIIDRNDQCINICEIKYADKPLIINKQYGNQLQARLENFKWQSGTKKNVFLTFITKSGLQSIQYDGHLIDHEITLQDFYQ